ncbi:O-antigen ligase family protein [Jannaschia sp. S6380]|uniref:O-antigen ligase family protein n=1 Tax=Jannaschia sp. S6380 TaxID=2926408 RepID=UPI001FF3D210|nr:O-antigen ligase family protein [Jannaschia sp. S6380]MCK0168480.1 O-antigen ligase family protein [Jannaschia sp. S6380]
MDAAIHDTGSRLRLRISAQRRDFVLLALWFGVTFVQFPGDELLLYPLSLWYAIAVWRGQRAILPLVARAWFVLLFPLWCFLSIAWAVEPLAALKHAVYLFLTMMICFQVAVSLTPRQIMHAILLATGVIGVINLLYAVGTGDMGRGIFAQKNTMGKNMVVLWIVAFATFLDPGAGRLTRLAALGLAVIAAVMAFASNSATAVLLVLASSGILLVGAIVLRGGLFRTSRLSLAFLFLGIVLIAGSFILPTLTVDPVEVVLDEFGKDTTLTGRTLLWQYADEQVAENPILGVGAGGFWRYHTSPLVQRIYFEFFKSPGDVFNFHNAYYEIAVHQGLIGMGLALIGMAWAVWMLGLAAFRIGTMPLIYFFTHMTVAMVRTYTEADFLRPFVLFHMVVWIGALVSCQALFAQARTGRRA